MIRLRHPARRLGALAILCVACVADRIVDVPADSHSRTVVSRIGQEVRITLGNVGPAQYESPPHISSDVVTYLGVEVIPPFNPGGPTQQFRFKAVNPGTAVVRFRRLLGDSLVFVVEDTIQVR